jgi:integrase
VKLKSAFDALPLPRGCGDKPRYFFWNGISSERAMKGIAERSLAAVFKASMVPHAHAHRFRHTLVTELLGNRASFEDVADILGNSPEIVRKHYAKWSPARQNRIDDLMTRVHSGANWTATETAKRVQ